MCRRGGVLDDEADCRVAARVVDVPFGVVGIGCVSRFGQQEERGVVVCAEGDVIHGPEEVAGAVDRGADFEGYGCGGGGGGRDGVEGRCLFQCVLQEKVSKVVQFQRGSTIKRTFAHSAVSSTHAVVVGFLFLSA